MKKKVLMLRIWMLKNDITNLDIANGYGCDISMIGRFLLGKRTSKGLVDHMIKIGAPKKLFKNGRVAA